MNTNKKEKTRAVIPLEQEIPEIESRKPWEIPTSYLIKDGKGGFTIVPERRPSKTIMVNNIRKEVDQWRDSGYKTPSGISQTSLNLLNYWFNQEHIVNGEMFYFRFAQREAIETIIYLYEVKQIRDNALLAEKYMEDFAYGSDLFKNKSEILMTARSKRIISRFVPETGMLANQDIPPEGLTRYCSKAATGSGKTLVMGFLIIWSIR